MSLLYVEQRDALAFGVWHITESESELEIASGCTAPARLTNPSRRLEYLAVRSLAVSMGINPAHIHYHPTGKPFLKGDTRAISLSHTKQYAAIVVGTNPLIGIDIEQCSERVERVRRKFMHPLEEAALEATSLDTLTGLLVHWCAKEAVFKAAPEVDIDFAKEIRVTCIPLVVPLAEVLQQVPPESNSQCAGRVTFVRTQTVFQLEAWSTPAFVMVICHSGVTDLSASE